MDVTERKALSIFYNATTGGSWENKEGWCTSAPIGEWFGVAINSHGSVLKLTLEFNNLIGEICNIPSVIRSVMLTTSFKLLITYSCLFCYVGKHCK